MPVPTVTKIHVIFPNLFRDFRECSAVQISGPADTTEWYLAQEGFYANHIAHGVFLVPPEQTRQIESYARDAGLECRQVPISIYGDN